MALKNLLGRKSTGGVPDEDLLRENESTNQPIIMKGSAPPVKTVNKRLIMVGVLSLGVIFALSFILGFYRNNDSSSDEKKIDHVTDAHSVAGKHLNDISDSYKDEHEQNDKNDKASKQTASQPPKPQPDHAAPDLPPQPQYQQVPAAPPIQRYESLPPMDPVQQVPQQPKSEFSDAQKSPISFGLSGGDKQAAADKHGEKKQQ